MIRNKIWIWYQPISFQIVWLVAVLGGNQLIILTMSLVCIHYWFTPSRKKDLSMLPFAMLGYSMDLILMQLGFFQFQKWPHWLLILWIAFVLNFGHSLSFLRKFNIPVLMIIGAMGGCYAYWVSWKLAAVEWPMETHVTCALIASLWALILPVLVKAELTFNQRMV